MHDTVLVAALYHGVPCSCTTAVAEYENIHFLCMHVQWSCFQNAGSDMLVLLQVVEAIAVVLLAS